MYQFNSEVNLVIQGCLVVIILGLVFHIFHHSKKRWIVMRLFSLGILCVAIASIERSLVNFAIILPNVNISMIQDVLMVLGLVFLGFGYVKLNSGQKA